MTLSINTIYHELEGLDKRSLDTFIDNILSLRIRRELSDRQIQESQLLMKINKGLSLKESERYHLLNQKRFDEVISEEEYVELEKLVAKIEKLNVTRIKYLTALARLRNISVRDLMIQLNLRNG
jgi:hypothetical protein